MISKNGSSFGTSDTSWYIRAQNNDGIGFGWYDGSTWVGPAVSTKALEPTGWNHLAGVKHGNMAYVFVNGKKVAEQDVSAYNGPQDTTENVTIGTAGTFGDSTGSNTCNGYISNIRIVKGTAVYTDDFEPPTGNLENISGTVLLCCQSSTNVTEAAVSPTTIAANGRAGASNFSPFINNLAQLRGPENNYATLEPGHIKGQSTEVVDGGLSLLPGGGSPWYNRPGSMGVSSGKWYWEVYPKSDNVTPIIGAGQDGHFMGMFESDVYPGQTSYGNAFGIQSNGTLRVNGTSTGGWHNTFGLNNNNNATISIALDMDAGKAYIAVNGFWGPLSATGTNAMVSNGTATAAATGLTGTYRPVYAINGGDSNDRMDINFGQRPFRFTPPEGFKCLNRTNLPIPSKAARNANKNFVPYIWSGTQTGSGGALSYEDIGFQPDFVWVKQRNQAYSTGHQLYDSVRGFGSDKDLDSSEATPEASGNIPTYGWINGTYENGFITKGGSTDYDYVNKSGVTYVAWCWKAGETFTPSQTGGITNLAGSRNTDAGFSIVKYTGSNSAATFGHGLNSAPEMIIIKNRDDSANWIVYHKDINPSGAPEDWYMMLHVDDARTLAGDAWGSTPPDSSVVHVGAFNNTNGSGDDLIAYCFHSVDGYCKVGGYIGNGDAEGPKIETGFKPSFVMTKRVDSNFGGEWSIFDNARNTTNPNNNVLSPDLNAVETQYSMDFQSNGFRLRMAGNWQNQGGGEYIYLAFAEAPTNAGFGAVVNAR